MSQFKQYFLLFALLACSVPMTITLTGCGSSSTNSAIQAQSVPVATTTTTTTTSGTSGSSSSGGSTSSVTFTPSQTYSFSLYGTGSGQDTYTSPAISTDNLLSIRITPDPAGTVNVPGSNFSAAYQCAGFTVTALGQSVTTGALGVTANVNSMCTGTSQIIDLSSQLAQGHGTIQIKVSNPMYDYYCQMYWYGEIAGTYEQYCPLHTVYQTHEVNGHIDIEVNGSST